MGNCSSANGVEKGQTSVNESSPRTVPTVPKTQEKTFSRRSFTSSSPKILVFQNEEVGLQQCLEALAALLASRQDESKLNEKEVARALKVYHELQRVLTKATRSGDWMARPSDLKAETDFHTRFEELVTEFDSAKESVRKALAAPASVQPLSSDSLQEVTDFFILDNSLRETTVGAPRGHTLEEKRQIVIAMAETGLNEVILGSFGSKISVDSQIAEQWRHLGKSFDSTWGFSDVYDCAGISEKDEDRLWSSIPEWIEAEEKEGETIPYFTPPADPVFEYSKSDLNIFNKASSGFCVGAFAGRNLKCVLKESSSKQGRVPLGLLMMAGYGIGNAIIEIDTSLETFDYTTHDIVERCKFLIRWCKENLPRRNVPEGEDDTSRVLINLRDFTNYNRSKGGLEQALRVVDSLSRLPLDQRPFGFMMEEPTGWLFPDEVGRLCKMVRLTMERAGFPEGRFLVHIHWAFGLAEAVQLAALCNGADGVWAAVCKTGAQVGHACSTMTAINLFRAGHHHLATQFNFEKMCKAAREVTAISTRQPCSSHEEIYGEQAFDIPYFMQNLPSCRYSLAMVLKEMGIADRPVRLNEIVLPSAVYVAMVHHFGPPDESGWDPSFCKAMLDAIKGHLLTGLSRDYNSTLGLGHLYSLTSRKELPSKMIFIMMRHSNISDYHPSVLEFIQRWNRLSAKYEDGELPPHPAAVSKSAMMWGTDTTIEPRLLSLPFDYFAADVMRNPDLKRIPRLFKLQMVTLLTQDESKIQEKQVPEIHFYDSVLRLKLFIEEAESLGVLGLVEDFCLRRHNDYLFGESNLWLSHGPTPTVAKKLLEFHMDFLRKGLIYEGNTAMRRLSKAAARRIDQNKELEELLMPTDNILRRVSVAFLGGDHSRGMAPVFESSPGMSDEHLTMLRALTENEGETRKHLRCMLRVTRAF
jgi:hypothetical protein